MVRLIWLRHASTRANRQKRYIGHLDEPLDNAGLQQAEQVARSFQHCPLTVVYSSDLLRARQTAEAILRYHPQAEFRLSPDLRELAFGEWEGLTYEEVLQQDRENLHRFYLDPWSHPPTGGETLGQMKARLSRFLEVLLSRSGNERVLAVSHGGLIRLFSACFLGNGDFFSQPSVAHGQSLVSAFDPDKGGWIDVSGRTFAIGDHD